MKIVIEDDFAFKNLYLLVKLTSKGAFNKNTLWNKENIFLNLSWLQNYADLQDESFFRCASA